jgi:peptidoglycan/xylan/chitin deacetylase (PgdA/CDA1 family)
MDAVKWQRMEDMLDRYGVKPMVGVIPHNEDPMWEIDPFDERFWQKVGNWEKKGWAIAMHGYNHCYISNDGKKGLNPMWDFSEFAGVPLSVQKEKIRKGIDIMREYGISPKYFFAPGHTFDENTLVALREESNIRIISDTIATNPYHYKDFIFIPQFGGQPREMKLKGIFTFCLHPTMMKEELFGEMERFFQLHGRDFITFDKVLTFNIREKGIFDHILSWFYYMKRKLK